MPCRFDAPDFQSRAVGVGRRLTTAPGRASYFPLLDR
jgi:hypothetical protein